MEYQNDTPQNSSLNWECANKPRENVLAGAVGAFLFALAGGVIWYVLYQVGFVAGISGLVAVICAIKGYSIFSKGESKRGVVIAAIMAVLVMIIAWYLCIATDFYNAVAELAAENPAMYQKLTFFESVRNAYLLLTEPEAAKVYLLDLGLGLLLCIVGAITPIRNAFKNKGAKKEEFPVIESDEK